MLSLEEKILPPLLFSVYSTPVLPQWHIKDPSHSAKSAGGRLHLNRHTPWTQLSQSGLIMPLSSFCVWFFWSFLISVVGWCTVVGCLRVLCCRRCCCPVVCSAIVKRFEPKTRWGALEVLLNIIIIIIVWEPIQKQAHTQHVREHSATVISYAYLYKGWNLVQTFIITHNKNQNILCSYGKNSL